MPAETGKAHRSSFKGSGEEPGEQLCDAFMLVVMDPMRRIRNVWSCVVRHRQHVEAGGGGHAQGGQHIYQSRRASMMASVNMLRPMPSIQTSLLNMMPSNVGHTLPGLCSAGERR
jgi:hypothetical protein